MEVRFQRRIFNLYDIIGKFSCQKKKCSETQYVEIGEWGESCVYLPVFEL